MAKITITVEAGAKVHTMTRTMSGPHLARFIEAVRTFYEITIIRTVDTGTGQSVPDFDLSTDEGALKVWANHVFASAKRIVATVETDAAKRAVTDVDMA